jgi:peptidoglycan/xylan/chitin deacetylase (PgdA/CDA1 family)
MDFRSQLGSVRRQVLGSLYSRRAPLGDGGPIVTFSFDDFPRSAYTVGGAVLKNFGARGTYYTAVGLMDTSNELGEQFRRADLDALVDDGHELASHTFSHISSRSVSDLHFVEEVDRGRKAIQEMTGQSDSGNFAFPFGEFTLGARKILSGRLRSCRSIWGGFNGPEIDLSLLRANSLYGDNHNAEAAKQLILQNKKRKSWLIFYTHDVRPDPSRFGCTTSLLESVISFASHSGARILTVDVVLTEITGAAHRDSLAAGVTA